MDTKRLSFLPQQAVEEACEWAMIHGIAFRQSDNTARHCPFSLTPMTMERKMYEHLLKVTPLLTKLISAVSEDHDFLQTTLGDMAKADPFFGRLMSLHQSNHGEIGDRRVPLRKPLLLMRSDFMDDRHLGAKVIEFNGIAAGMAPFGQKATEFHQFIKNQWPQTYFDGVEDPLAIPANNFALEQMAYGIAAAAKQIQRDSNGQGQLTFLMVIQKNEDNVYDQHLLELELQKHGLRTVRRTFDQLSTQLSTGDNQRLLLEDVGEIDVVYLRAGYQYVDYCAPQLNEPICCQTLSDIRLFIEQHSVAVNATISQQLATSKSMQMILTLMSPEEYGRWGLTLEEAFLVKSVLADMKPINEEVIQWFDSISDKQAWVLKNQGEGGGHCIFGEDIAQKLVQLTHEEYDAWALMQRLYPHEREKPVIAIRDGKQTLVNDFVSEVGLFSVYFDGKPVTEYGGYAGYLIRSKPAGENEGGIHSGKGVLDSLLLI